MFFLRVSLGLFLVIRLVEILIGYGALTAIKEIKTDSKTVIKDTTNILRQNPRNYDALTRRGYAYFSLFKPKDAISDYTSALGILPSAELYRKRADAYALDGQEELANKDRSTASNYHLR
jgi:tetratricopeptide (TPR) repeat protein